MPDRKSQIVGSIELATAKGLELGPLTNPVVRRSDGDIRYLDHVDTEALHSRYASHDGFDVDAIVPIDYAMGDGSVRSAVGDDAPFDYVIASHVIEHVPDLIGWLDDIRSVLADDGVLSLAVPDHRRCFDVLRLPSVAAEVVEAHLRNATVPSPRQVFDHYSSARLWRGAIGWAEEAPADELVPVHSQAEALERATESAMTGVYHDVHCWVFTPGSFCQVFGSLQRLHLVPFSVESCTETIGGEFFARLRPADPATATVPAADDESQAAADDPILQREVNAMRASRDAALAELAAMKGSRSWRVTRPLRGLNALIRKRRR